jgi:ABC-type dipeptide/oligopeptide/nickel transport system ATPase component
MSTPPPILEVQNLSVALPISGRMVPVVTDLSLSIAPGEAVALVGESGCGKSMTARAIIGLPPPGAAVSGSIRLDGRELTTLAPRERRRVGGGIGFIFQEPMTSLHPTLSIGQQMTDGLR